MNVYHAHAWCPQGPEVKSDPVTPRVIDGFELPCGGQRLNLGPVQERQVPYITEPPLRLLLFVLGTVSCRPAWTLAPSLTCSHGCEFWVLLPAVPMGWDYRHAMPPGLKSVWLRSMQTLVRWQSFPLLFSSGFQLFHRGFPTPGGQCALSHRNTLTSTLRTFDQISVLPTAHSSGYQKKKI